LRRRSAARIGLGTALGSLLGLGARLIARPGSAAPHQGRREGDPRSAHSDGCLCPKGAVIYQLLAFLLAGIAR
jgi:hypothetical protein